jgi:molybdopterin synthase catalytic subunit
MRTFGAFILGAITSGFVTWLWGKEITGYVREQTRGVRTQAAEGLQAVADSTEKVLDRGGDALRRAEEVLQATKTHVGDALRTGQDALRPTPAARAT